jgi:hypothetical protein
MILLIFLSAAFIFIVVIICRTSPSYSVFTIALSMEKEFCFFYYYEGSRNYGLKVCYSDTLLSDIQILQYKSYFLYNLYTTRFVSSESVIIYYHIRSLSTIATNIYALCYCYLYQYYH